ncbi:Nif3-like dinuclear metal center hexameric protein [Deltaproteobacteria bacterium OttesenSCG-928-M10]|nr:Nif3-like dinuclear metal center hexameric protein [Deltaproteobacteria bacterium OttesenSCG-928-M10]
MQVRDLIGIINQLAPPDLAADWDNPGLQVGSPDHEVKKIGLALDATDETVAAALAADCDLLLVHHPLIFKPLKNIDFNSSTGKVIARAGGGGLAVVSAHTNWDSAERGVARALADVLELEALRPLEPAARDFLKLVVFAPAGYETKLRSALFEAGAGVIGHYDRCWFQSDGEGGFRTPVDGDPFLGRRGQETRTRESRLEMVLPASLADKAAEAIYRHHPYEEPAFEFHPVKVFGRAQGPGLMGLWNPPRDLLECLGRTIGTDSLKWAGPQPSLVERVALLPGSGGGYLQLAHRLGAEALVTGDVSYHQALEAESLGITLIDLGHFETEWPGVLQLARLLEAELGRLKLTVECQVLGQTRPWNY